MAIGQQFRMAIVQFKKPIHRGCTDESGIDEAAIAVGNGPMARCESHLFFEIAM